MPAATSISTANREYGMSAHPAREGGDEITLIARRVLDDLEAFVDSTPVEDGDADSDSTGRQTIDVTLEELQLILETSIRRHAGQTMLNDKRMDTTPSSINNAHSLREKSPRSSYRARFSRLNNWSELHDLLETKQQQFARVREQNRLLERPERGRFVVDAQDRQQSSDSDYDRQQDTDRHSQPRQTECKHRHWEHQENDRESFISSRSSSPAPQASYHRYERTDMLPRDQATETDQALLFRAREDKECTDLGPSAHLVPLISERGRPDAYTALRVASSRSSASSLRSMSSASSSSSSSFSASSSSIASTTSKPRSKTRSHSSSRSNSSSHNGRNIHPPVELDATSPGTKPTPYEPLNRPHDALGSSHQEWDLDLSNFNP